MLKRSGSLSVSFAIAVMLAVGAMDACAQSPPASPPPSGTDDIAAPFPGPASPLDLEAAGDATRRVAARIGPAGGVLRTTGADGASYELTIPARSLGEEVEIAMTPIASVKGLPEELAEGHGVILEPDGLILSEIGLLRVSRPGMQVSMDSIALVGEGRGADSHMTLFRPEPGAMLIAVAHFTIFRSSADDLVKGARTAERIAQRRRRAEQIVPRSQHRRFEHLVAVHLSRNHDRLQRAIDAVTAWLVRADLRRGNPDLACPAFRQAYRAQVDVMRAARKLGYTDYPETPPLNASQIEYLVDQCRREAENFCRANMDGTRINEQVHAETRAGGGAPEATTAVVRWANDALKRCLPNELVIRTVGEGVFTDTANCRQRLKFDVEMKIRLGMSEHSTVRIPKLEGQAPHTIHVYEHEYIRSCPCYPSGRHDVMKPVSSVSREPARARVGLYGVPGNRKLLLELDPGIVWSRWHVRTCAGSSDEFDDSWWRENFRAHYSSRIDGYRISFELAPEGGNASDVFQGSGARTDSAGTWRGNERTAIRFLRAQ